MPQNCSATWIKSNKDQYAPVKSKMTKPSTLKGLLIVIQLLIIQIFLANCVVFCT